MGRLYGCQLNKTSYLAKNKKEHISLGKYFGRPIIDERITKLSFGDVLVSLKNNLPNEKLILFLKLGELFLSSQICQLTIILKCKVFHFRPLLCKILIKLT